MWDLATSDYIITSRTMISQLKVDIFLLDLYLLGGCFNIRRYFDWFWLNKNGCKLEPNSAKILYPWIITVVNHNFIHLFLIDKNQQNLLDK